MNDIFDIFEQMFDESNNHFEIRKNKKIIVGCQINNIYFYSYKLINHKKRIVFKFNLN